MLILFLKLLLAHIVGDFVLQTKSLVTKRGENVLYLLLHTLIHTVLLFIVFLPVIGQFWIAAVSLGVDQLVIVSIKIFAEKVWPHKPMTVFLVDQAVHVFIIIAVVFGIFGYSHTLLENISLVKVLLYL